MLFLNENPFIRQSLHSYLDMEKAAKDLFQPFQSRDSRLFYILSGKGEMFVDGIAYPIQPDMILLFKAGTPYEWRVENADYYSVNFDYDHSFCHIRQTFHPITTKAVQSDIIFDCGPIEDCPALEKPIVLYKSIALKRPIQNILTESAMTDRWHKPLLSSMMKSVLIEILRAAERINTGAENTKNIKEIIGYIQDHYIQPLNNQTIAAKFGYNPTYLGRIFKAQTGMTLHEFIVELRLNAAMELLTDTSLPIGQICARVGMPDLYHFSKFFKKKTGTTPSQYRAKK